MENLFYMWLVVAALCLIMEVGNPGLFFFLSFFFGALAATIATVYADSWIAQSVIFFVGTLIALVILKYWVKSYEQDTKVPLTNVYALQGKRGVVIIDITNNQPGQVKISGEIWSARSVHNEHIKVDATVEVVSVHGAHVQVKEVK